MAAITQPPPMCEVCQATSWFRLQPEDNAGTPHHVSRTALELSAKTCNLCAMILRAALSNYRDSRGIRDGRGYWRILSGIRLQSPRGIRDMRYTKDMGSCRPTSTDSYGDNFRVIAPTGIFDDNHEHFPSSEGTPDLKSLGLDDRDPPIDMPVWLYGNWWAAASPKGDGDISHARLVGIGARFGRTQSVFDAFGNKAGEVHLRGSGISICTTDGKLH